MHAGFRRRSEYRVRFPFALRVHPESTGFHSRAARMEDREPAPRSPRVDEVDCLPGLLGIAWSFKPLLNTESVLFDKVNGRGYTTPTIFQRSTNEAHSVLFIVGIALLRSSSIRLRAGNSSNQRHSERSKWSCS